jgi:hypothetical protein
MINHGNLSPKLDGDMLLQILCEISFVSWQQLKNYKTVEKWHSFNFKYAVFWIILHRKDNINFAD